MEGELIQAIGRARAIRRNESNPQDILILTNVPIPIKVELLTTWGEVVPTKLEKLLATANIAPLSYNELQRIYPDSFKTRSEAITAVKNFFDRYESIKAIVKSNLSAILPIYNINRENRTQFQNYKELGLVNYTRNTKGAKPCFAVIFILETNEIEEALTALVGELKSYKYICAFSADGEALP
jgi:nitroreductase